MVGIDHMSVGNGGRGGMIVNISSLRGLLPFPCAPVYCASKHGVVGFTRSLANKELADELGIKFVLICPGFTDTSLLSNVQPKLFAKNSAQIYTKMQEKSGIQTCVTQNCSCNKCIHIICFNEFSFLFQC